jgi:hypothetical protein
MTTKISTKYCLSLPQIDLLMDAGLVTKTTWYLQNLTTREFISYTSMFNIRRVSGADQLDLEFPDGYFAPGTEVKAGVGDWNTVDANGRHCQQTAFWYVDENGTAIPCKYKELPSQNGGVIPQPKTYEFPKELMQESPSPANTPTPYIEECDHKTMHDLPEDEEFHLKELGTHVACTLGDKVFCCD